MNGKSSVPPSPSPPPPLQFKHSIIFSSYVSTRSGVRSHLYVPCPVVAGARCESEWSGQWSCYAATTLTSWWLLYWVLSAWSGPAGRRKTIDAITHCCLRLSSEHLAPARPAPGDSRSRVKWVSLLTDKLRRMRQPAPFNHGSYYRDREHPGQEWFSNGLFTLSPCVCAESFQIITTVLFQNVYVNISRILTAANKLVEGGHYAGGHVRWEPFSECFDF